MSFEIKGISQKPITNQQLAFLWGCGKISIEEDDNEVGFYDEPHGSDPIVLDDFEDGNLTAESFNLDWKGFNGFNLENKDGVLRAEGYGYFSGIQLYSSTPIDVSSSKYIEFDISGNVKMVRIELKHAGEVNYYLKTIPSTKFRHFQIPLEFSSITHFQIMVESWTPDQGGWIELDNVNLTR